MLANANEEKNIQVAIIQDELAESRRTIEEMTRQRVALDAQLQHEREERERELAQHKAEMAGLRARLDSGAPVTRSQPHIAASPDEVKASYARADLVGKQATQEIQKIRQNAERHLEWIRKRLKMVHGADGVPGSPSKQSLDETVSRAADFT